MSKRLTPLEIEVLLHFHCTPEPLPQRGIEVWDLAVKNFLHQGVIVHLEPKDGEIRLEGRYRTSKLGQAWVEALCNVPIPKTVYQDQAGNIIEV